MWVTSRLSLWKRQHGGHSISAGCAGHTTRSKLEHRRGAVSSVDIPRYPYKFNDRTTCGPVASGSGGIQVADPSHVYVTSAQVPAASVAALEGTATEQINRRSRGVIWFRSRRPVFSFRLDRNADPSDVFGSPQFPSILPESSHRCPTTFFFAMLTI